MTDILSQIASPDDLKRLSIGQLPSLAEEIRAFLLETLAKTGGHLGANLGVVELTLSLHYVFDSPRDRLVWDVSHQIYTHKLLTGRKAQFASLRQLDGLSGFAKRNESEHDAFDAGHGGTSISVALGMARARALTGEPGKVIAVIGDGSLTSGMALEAINDAGHTRTNLLVILNDNAMAISPNVGAIARHLSQYRSDRGYLRAKAAFETFMQRIPGGHHLLELIRRVKAGIKQLLLPGMLFENLGFTYLGPVDGHNIPALIEILHKAQSLEGPVLLHVQTVKGKGYTPAEEHTCRLHGVTAFDLETGEPTNRACGETFTDRFGAVACRLAAEDTRIVAVSAAMCEGTGLPRFRESFPSRFFDVGMAEEHAVTLAAGMAGEGMRPIVAIYSTFLQRAYDQILHDICLQRLPVVLALDRAGLVGDDGPTHHGVFDLSYLRMMPGMSVLAPASLDELEAMLEWAVRQAGPCAIRYPRGAADIVLPGDPVSIGAGRAGILHDGDHVAIVAIGSMVNCALLTAELLEREGIGAAVVNARFVKPLDTRTLLDVARGARLIVTLEENSVVGGFGTAVHELMLKEDLHVPVLTLGVPDRFIEHGNRTALLERIGLTPSRIAEAILARLPATKIRFSLPGGRRQTGMSQ